MVIREYTLLLLVAGTLTGTVAAVIATLPSLLSPNNDISIGFILAIVLVLIIESCSGSGGSPVCT
jgi:hypothetical protein